MPTLLYLALGLLGVGLFIYWLLFVTEGAYLGERVVVWLYDIYANRYDRIKDWVIEDEIIYLAEPFAAAVGLQRQPPLILDVAAGTGRLVRAVTAAALLPKARWVLLDASPRMLARAKRLAPPAAQVHFIQHSACPLPFPDAFFDVVTCLEALEFMPQPTAALAEMVRVLRPGGLLLVTNRVGRVARLMPRRTWSQTQVYEMHKALGQRNIAIRPFLVDYDWVSSYKAGAFQPPGRAEKQEYVAVLPQGADA